METDGNFLYKVPKNREVPEIMDYHVVYSTLFGCVSFRNPEEGSVFIGKLCKYLMAMAAQHDLQTILQRVRADMKNWSHKEDEEEEYVTQIPEDQSTLIGKVYFDVQS